MRRFLLASLAFLVLFLPYQVGEAASPAAQPCCPCMGAPACPPACPAPSPAAACLGHSPVLVAVNESEELAARNSGEPSPVPAHVITHSRVLALQWASGAIRGIADAPDRSDGQAFLRVFRI